MTGQKKARPEGLDYFLAAIAPVFIIGMIGSLVYFLITVLYQGSHTERLMWILGLYTLATVLIARIAIEQSRQLAFAYMFALAAATLFVTPQIFVVSGAMAIFSFPILFFLLVMVAVLADRITFDCTSMNEQVQSTGVGLLQSLGLVRSERKQSKTKQEDVKEKQDEPAGSSKKSTSKRKHNPGVWVLYFALFALPLFGLGQLLIQNPIDRSWAFTYLFFYLLSSLFLLVLISLLSLRKYLRERGVPMEPVFAIRWLAIGMSSVFVILLALSLLPIPGHSLLSMNSPFRIASRDDLKANQWGWGREGAQGDGPQQGEDQNKPGGQKNGNGPDEGGEKVGDKQNGGKPNGDEPSKNGTEKSEPKTGKDGKNEPNEKQRQSDDGKQPNGEVKNGKPLEKNQPKNEDQQTKAEDPKHKDQQGDGKQPPPENKAENKAENEAQQQPVTQSFSLQWNFPVVLQWLLMMVLAIAAIVYGIIYRRELLAAIKNFRDWLGSLFGGKKKLPLPKSHTPEEAILLEDLYPPFHTFANPFATGNGWTREQVVRHMYRAMLSWGYEHRIVRREDETPEEFMRRLLRRFPEQQESFSMLGMLYNRIAYARGKVSTAELRPMSEFWQWLATKTT